MLNRVRQFLRDRSPDWLNTEVNKDLLQNLSTTIRSPQPNTHNNSEATNKNVPPSSSLSYEEKPRERSKKTEKQINTHLAINPSNSDEAKLPLHERPLMTDDCSLFPEKGTPHRRRTIQVFRVLDTAPPNSTYDQLIQYVREATGKGCSRKLISKWKKQRNLQSNSARLPQVNVNPINNSNSTGDRSQSDQYAIVYQPKLNSNLSTVNSFHSTKSSSSFSSENILDRSFLSPVQIWSYVAAAGITFGLMGCELIPTNPKPSNQNLTTLSTTQTVVPQRKNHRLEPRSIKIQLTLSHPQDLKVKPGEQITAGQILSDRTTERRRLEAKKKQLQLSLEKLNLPLTPIPQPKPIPEIAKLPPVSYVEAEAAIKLKQHSLKEANQAIAQQQTKIARISQLIEYQ